MSPLATYVARRRCASTRPGNYENDRRLAFRFFWIWVTLLNSSSLAHADGDPWRSYRPKHTQSNRIESRNRFVIPPNVVESETLKPQTKPLLINRTQKEVPKSSENNTGEKDTENLDLLTPSLKQIESDNTDPSSLSDAPLYNDGGGFELRLSEDKKKPPFSLILNGRIQTRFTRFTDRSQFENPSLTEFELERVRLGFRGYVYDRALRYNIGTDWDSDGVGGNPTSGNLLHAFVELRLDKVFDISWGDRLSLRGGLWRTNFGRQAAESSKRLQFVDRSLTSTVFNLGTNAGIALRGEFTYDYRPVGYELALLNGFGSGNNQPGDGLDNNLAVAARVYHDLIGDYEIGESDNQLSSSPALRVGANFAASRRTRVPPDGSRDEFDDGPALLLVSDPANGDAVFAMDNLLGKEREYDLWLWGFETSWKYCGWSLHSEYLFRLINNVQFVDANGFNDFTHGFYIQGGYFLTEFLELTARFSRIFAHGKGSGSPIGRNYRTTSDAVGVGTNFYFRGHDSKLQFDLFYYDGAPISSSALNIQAGDRGVAFRAQYQLSF